MNKDSGSLLELAAVRVLANGLDHPEGIALAPDGVLYAGGEAGQLYLIDPAVASHEQVAATGGFILGVCLDAAGRVYMCDAGRQAVLRFLPSDGSVEVYCDSAGGRPLRWPNFPVFAADGSLWVSDSGTLDPSVIDGTLVRVPPGGGEAEVLDLRPLHCSNGLALAPNDDLYVIESFAPRVSVLRADGLAPYVELPRTLPDGLALDAEGGLFVSCYQPNRIYRVPPGGGEPAVVLDDWRGISMTTPTNVAFFGAEMDQLAIASLGGWGVRAIETPWRGQPLHYPEAPR